MLRGLQRGGGVLLDVRGQAAQVDVRAAVQGLQQRARLAPQRLAAGLPGAHGLG
jgi:hypothetical protein